jgi:hypothetical protein
VIDPFRRSAGRADGGGCGVAEAEPETITASELANGEIPVDILQGDRDHGQVANAHAAVEEIKAEEQDLRDSILTLIKEDPELLDDIEKAQESMTVFGKPARPPRGRRTVPRSAG